VAFDPGGLNVLAHTDTGFTLWHYRTADDIDTVLSLGYFSAAAPLITACDRIQLTCGGGHGDLVVLNVGTIAGEPFVRVNGLVLVQV
jgi:hypothetical protein